MGISLDIPLPADNHVVWRRYHSRYRIKKK